LGPIDRDQFELALNGNDKYAAFLQALSDPAYASCSFPTLLRKFNISLHETQTVYTDHMRHMGLLRMSNQLPQVMADVTEDARSHMRACPRCDGEKVMVSTRGNKTSRKQCPECKGTGEVRVIGDRHARDLVFESMKLTRQREGPLVAIQQNIGESTLSTRMEDLLKQTQKIVMGDRSANAWERPANELNAVDDVDASSAPIPK